MTPVSTAAQLLTSLQLDDLIYGVVGSQGEAVEQEEQGTKLWNIPGLGVVGIGAATAAVVAIYVANPGMKEDLQTINDLFGENRDEKLDIAAEHIGQRGAEVNVDAPVPEGKPRIEAEPVKLSAPKAEPKPVDTPETTVSRGYQVQGSGMPLSTGPLARPTAEIDTVLQNTAKTEGVDYRTLYALAGSESSFSAGATAKNSSATGLFQFTAPTWRYLTQEVYPELGFGPGDRTDPQKSAVVAARYLKSISASLAKKLGRSPSVGETYLGYFMGPTGASKFLDALHKNPDAKGAEVFPSAAKSNPYLFYHKGDRNKPLTLAETMGRLEGKVTAYYEQAGQVQVARAEIAVPVMDSAKPIPVRATIPATATPQPVPVAAPDFNAVKGGAKGEARDMQQSSPKGGTQGAQAPIATSGPGKKEQVGETTYVRDKHGRLITIRS
jgi:hypothetical protein